MTTSFESFRAAVAVYPARSKWAKAVVADALTLLENLNEEIPENARFLEKALLNGAADWYEYSWGGCALVYSAQIAAHYCTPSELKSPTRRGGAVRNPNSREEWCDLQARALSQAANIILETYRRLSFNL